MKNKKTLYRWSLGFFIFGCVGICVGLTKHNLLFLYLVWTIISGVIMFPARKKYKASQSLIDESKKNPVAPVADVSTPAASHVSSAKQCKVENHKVAGLTFYMDNIMSLSCDNPYYDMTEKELIEDCMIGEKIFEYDFDATTTELIEEPGNPHDPNAVKVVIDGVHVGYIKKGSCAHIKNLLHSDYDLDISSSVFGGKYKIVYEDSEDSEDSELSESYTMEKDSYDISITVTITY